MTAKPHLVVVGNGMAGARFVEDLLARGGGERYRISVYGDEPCGNYNRILLSGVLAGTHRPDDIFINPLAWYATNGITFHAGVRVEAIDARNHQLTAAGGLTTMPHWCSPREAPADPADRRSRPRSARSSGVFVFRTLADCIACSERTSTRNGRRYRQGTARP